MRNLPEKLAVLGLIVLLISALYAVERLTVNPSAVLGEVNGILDQVQGIRKLTFKERPEIVVLTKSEALVKWKPGKADIESMRTEELTYKMTLLLPPDYQYIKKETERSAGWIAATVGDTIYIIQENFMSDPDTARRTIAHESVHVLQKQWFNAKYGADTYDGTIAVQSLIEGDADLVADLYCEKNGIPIHKIRSLSGDPLTDLHIFPYVFGDRFVRYLYEKGNWSLVNEAYSRYPVSAQQVMHPELYLENVTPLNVTLNAPPNSRVLKEDRLGEYYVYLLFRDVAKLEDETAWNVSSAWRGDRLLLTQNATDYLLQWKVVFSTPEAAKAFGETLSKLAEGNTYANYTIRIDGSSVLLIAERRD
ncbi:eCIS core domain-containing protein [Thermococcus aciditolerans]|uniref:DUF4157 domain-containing protein n=1 Tax=Thermococcus aciditolerans TaxID=2598455 RepID=A0A5C0SLU4_9EURY|nr:DUF4157 domain-containing protein [Thermococcus aciditolerans]QEK15395.1 DUF4157 domain-containing protein [Thermococcus aciditolerans]